MPIYEFYSPDTHTVYSFFARSVLHGDAVPRCPDGDQHRMQRQVSSFAVIRSGDAEADDAYGPDDAKMEAALNEVEREFRGIDENNPDPRQMGAMMRRLHEITGQRLPESMQEMMARLEAGEDPDALEDMFGDELEGDMEDYAGDREADADESASGKKLRALLRRRGPKRDPNLYELTDYL